MYYPPKILASASLRDAQKLLRAGRVTEDEIAEYLRSWNAAPRFTQAVLDGDRIVNFDPEGPEANFYRDRFAYFGVRL